MPVGLKLPADQGLLPFVLGALFASDRTALPERSPGFAFQSRAGTGDDFTTGTPLPPSLRAGGAGEGSLLGQGRTRLLSPAEPPNSPAGFAASGKGWSKGEKSWWGSEGAEGMDGDAPWAGTDGAGVSTALLPRPGAGLGPPRCCPERVFVLWSLQTLPETSAGWGWVQVPFFLLCPLQCPCQ